MSLDSLSVSSNPVEVASGGADFSQYSTAGTKWGGVRFLKVTGAGSIEVRLVSPRDGHPTETFTMRDDETLPGQIAELVSADPACYPVKAWR